MHHSKDQPTGRLRDELRELAGAQKLGATGEFPQGKLDPTDEGEIKFAVGSKDGKVILAFGKSVAWVGMDPKQARELAEAIRQQSYKAEQGS